MGMEFCTTAHSRCLCLETSLSSNLRKMSCPCCSGLPYSECCEPFHLHFSAPSPLALMRSRYTAYALGKTDYIIRTTHPGNPHYDKNRKQWERTLQEFCRQTEFCKLDILETTTDTVTFAAYLRQGGKEWILQEKSQFRKIDGHWL